MFAHRKNITMKNKAVKRVKANDEKLLAEVWNFLCELANAAATHGW
jgi:hypothetical protein